MMNPVKLLRHLKCGTHHRFVWIASFCIVVVLLYAFCIENTMSDVKTILGQQTQTMTQPHARSNIKVHDGNNSKWEELRVKEEELIGKEEEPKDKEEEPTGREELMGKNDRLKGKGEELKGKKEKLKGKEEEPKRKEELRGKTEVVKGMDGKDDHLKGKKEELRGEEKLKRKRVELNEKAGNMVVKPLRAMKVWNDDTSRNMLDVGLKKIVQNYQAMNIYGVKLSEPNRKSGRSKLTGPELLCQLKKKAEVTTLTSDLEPFSALPWATQLPRKQLTSDVGPYKSCAVVSSAGSLLHSRLGKEIDSHDAVVRFNGALTRGFERDVGSKTTLQIINSQVMVPYKFLYHSLYNSGVLVAWDPAPFSSNLTQWYNHTEYPIFPRYQKYKKLNPLQPFYILHPRFNWQLWQLIQDNMAEPIQKNPPSSGFLGIVLMMSLCEVVHVYEFLPSYRRTALCHYYQRWYNPACTFGSYHPLMYEKNLVKRMNLGSDDEIYLDGRVTLPGFSSLKCTDDGIPEH